MESVCKFCHYVAEWVGKGSVFKGRKSVESGSEPIRRSWKGEGLDLMKMI